MQHLGDRRETAASPRHPDAVRARVRFLAYHRIKPHVPPLVRAPVNSFEAADALSRRQRAIIVYGVDYQGI